MKDIQYEIINENYVEQAIKFVLHSYDLEKEEIPFLPNKEYFYPILKKAITNLFQKGHGVMALHKNELVGFLAGYYIEEFFGPVEGIYCPLYGHGINRLYSNDLYKLLYKKASELWVENKWFSHAITLFAHQKQVIDTWFWLGFGHRCVDSIRQSKLIDTKNSNVKIRKIDDSDIPLLAEIHRTHNMYYRQAPLFMPKNEDEDPILDLKEWLYEDNHHLWAAFYQDKPVGYMKIQPTGESFVSYHQDVMNITGAFIQETERNLGVGSILLNEIQKWLINNNYPLCGVDFESFNIAGSSFWNKHFTPYTYSLVRRIDERIKR